MVEDKNNKDDEKINILSKEEKEDDDSNKKNNEYTEEKAVENMNTNDGETYNNLTTDKELVKDKKIKDNEKKNETVVEDGSINDNEMIEEIEVDKNNKDDEKIYNLCDEEKADEEMKKKDNENTEEKAVENKNKNDGDNYIISNDEKVDENNNKSDGKKTEENVVEDKKKDDEKINNLSEKEKVDENKNNKDDEKINNLSEEEKVNDQKNKEDKKKQDNENINNLSKEKIHQDKNKNDDNSPNNLSNEEKLDEGEQINTNSKFDDDQNKKKNEEIKKNKDEEEKVKESTDKLKSDFKEILNSSMRKNARRIQKEFHIREFSANNYLNTLEIIIGNYNHLRFQIQSLSNYFIDYFFSYFGYKYESQIKNINFFHFATQSWVLEAFQNIINKFRKSKINIRNEESKINTVGNYSFSDILCEILNFEANEQTYFSNFEIIAGNMYFNDVAKRMTELKLGKYFLNYIKFVCNQMKNEYIPTTLSKDDFECKLMVILIKAVELTLNKIENDSSDSNINFNTSKEKYIKFICHLQTLKNRKNIEFNFQNYLTILKQDSIIKLSDNESDESGFLNSSEAFYHFSICSFTDLVKDLNVLISESSNLFYKLRKILFRNREKLRNLYFNLSKNLSDIYSKSSQYRIDLKSLKNFYQYCENKLANVKEMKIANYNLGKFEKYKSWMKDNYDKNLRIYPYFLVNIWSQYHPSIDIYEKVYNPMKDFTISFTSNSVKFLIESSKNFKSRIDDVQKFVFEVTKKNYDYLAEDIFFSKNPLIQISQDNENDLIIIKISRRIILNDRKKFNSLMEDLSSLFSRIKIKENFIYIYNKTKENTIFLKENLLDRYKKFLSSSISN